MLNRLRHSLEVTPVLPVYLFECNFNTTSGCGNSVAGVGVGFACCDRGNTRVCALRSACSKTSLECVAVLSLAR